MPWKIAKSGKGYVVVTKGTGRKHSKKPMSKARAQAQLAALNIQKKKGKIR